VVEKSPPGGVRNMAESSVTIEDVVFVVDSGLMKERHYNPAGPEFFPFIILMTIHIFTHVFLEI